MHLSRSLQHSTSQVLRFYALVAYILGYLVHSPKQNLFIPVTLQSSQGSFTLTGFGFQLCTFTNTQSLQHFWEFLRYALRLHLLFSLFGDKSNTSMDMSGSGRIPPLPNLLVHLLSYNLVAAAGTERWLTWEKQESGAGMIWPSNLAPKIQSSYPWVRSNSSVVERLGEK